MTPTMKNTTQPISILLCALGGEGGGVLAEWLIEAARRAGYPAQATSIPGVAQRTGATTYYLEFFPVPLADLAGRRPVFGLNPLPGRLDLLVSSELLETARQIGNGLPSSTHTRVITSSSRTLTTAEKMQIGDGRQNDAALLSLVRQHSQAHHVLDMAQLTREAGTVVSAVMLGCIAASGVLPFGRAVYEDVVRGEPGAPPAQTPGKAAQASLRGFGLGFDAVKRQREQTRLVAELLSTDEQTVTLPRWDNAEKASKPLEKALASFPAPLRERIALGLARTTEYQDAAYGQLYLERLHTVLAAEQQADPAGASGYATIHEVARWLALWMAFDDIVRVADLKSRASRWTRVVGEVKATEGDLVRVYDHFKPGVPEFAALLPPRWAVRLQRWDHARVMRGLLPWALPLKIGTHSVVGMVGLRLLAACRRIRPLGSRYATEQALIQLWLDAVVMGLRNHAALGHEIALCGRLIKGYGSTNERGKDNLLHVLQHLAVSPTLPDPAARARAIAAARTAALQDEAGTQFDAALREHGAPARALREQPIRWMRKPRTAE
jgi:indolepyruvate ferredoxin oxidoreductase beta subunit